MEERVFHSSFSIRSVLGEDNPLKRQQNEDNLSPKKRSTIDEDEEEEEVDIESSEDEEIIIIYVK
jgi:hypothetical protein